MPLDPDMKLLLDQLKAAGLPPDFAAIGATEAKRSSAATGQMMGVGPTVARIEDLKIAGPNGSIAARLYVPEGQVTGLIVFYHGGGWVVGDIDGYDAAVRRLAVASGAALISVEYRTAPEHSFPVPVEDCYAALLFAEREMERLVGARVGLVVAGDSAGGNLAAVVAIAARDRHGPALAAQLLIFPVTDADFETSSYLNYADGYMLPSRLMQWFWDQYVPDVQDRTDPMAAPLRATSLAGLPTALIEIAGYDPLRDEIEAYAARLEEAGVKTYSRLWAGLCHGFFQLALLLPPAGLAVDAMGSKLRKILLQAE